MRSRNLFIIAGISGASAVGLGAFGAHGLRDILEPKMLMAWDKAVLYQFIHTLALLFLPIVKDKMEPPIFRWIGVSWIAGIILFAGSIYLLVLTKMVWLGPITPIGGIAFIVGWLCLIIGSIKMKKEL